MNNLWISIIIISTVFGRNQALLEDGKWDYNLTKEYDIVAVSKTVYKGAQVFIKVSCEPENRELDPNIIINIVIQPSQCWDFKDATAATATDLHEVMKIPTNNVSVYNFERKYECSEHIILDKGLLGKDEKSLDYTHPNYVMPHDGAYTLGIRVHPVAPDLSGYSVGFHIEIRNDYGYLSARDWPLLPFYELMCVFYVILGVIWLVLSFLQWRDLLRVQFWIGGVILLGMLEKATFYAELQSLNSSGVHVVGAMLFAEWVSCAKRTLARMLVVIVSLGFGIVKPRLGSTLHRVVGVGFLYFFLAASEAYMRVTTPINVVNKELLVASVPLAVLDSAICWWIFSALVNTTRTLRLRRNEIKLNLYRHFTNTLIFAVLASICFMLYSIKTHRFVTCLVIWKDLWLEDAYWHILFSALLLVIMILWRPTNNNQRYAFVPLLDTGDDEEEEQLVNDAYGVKVRTHHPKSQSPRSNSVDDELRWLEENIKSDPALPILDSDEELVNTRFEVSKMQ